MDDDAQAASSRPTAPRRSSSRWTPRRRAARCATTSRRLARAAGRRPRCTAPAAWSSDASLIEVVSRYAVLDERSQQLVDDMRGSTRRPFPALRGRADRATSWTSSGASCDHLPVALAIVVVATLVVLFLMTGSVVLPIKALIMNVLTLSATFGLLVLIFQDGDSRGCSTTRARARSR